MSEAAAAVEWVWSGDSPPLDVRSLFFGRDAPLEVDLGCGDGTFLAALAAAQPERNFLGVERMAGRVCTACRQIAERKLANVRVIRTEIAVALDEILPPASVDVVHLMFSDPWPKRRHQRRRVVTPEFFASLARVLKPGGIFRVVTDDAEYFAQIVRLAASAPGFEQIALADAALPQSKFEQHFRSAGLPIHRVVLRKTSPVR